MRRGATAPPPEKKAPRPGTVEAFREMWPRVEGQWRRAYGGVCGPRKKEVRAALERDLARLYGCGIHAAGLILEQGIERAGRFLEVQHVEDARRAAEETIRHAAKRPRGCSEVRWRIEMKRRERARAGIRCDTDPDWL